MLNPASLKTLFFNLLPAGNRLLEMLYMLSLCTYCAEDIFQENLNIIIFFFNS